MKRLIVLIVLFNSFFVSAQTKIVKPIWNNYSENINNGYLIQFKYPSYFKLDRIENCICLGLPDKSGEYNNTMDWGIWINEPKNYRALDNSFVKQEFNNDFIVKKDTIIISKYKAQRILIKQLLGKKYYEIIVIKLNDCVFEIINKKKESNDFRTFYNSIRIIPNAIKK